MCPSSIAMSRFGGQARVERGDIEDEGDGQEAKTGANQVSKEAAQTNGNLATSLSHGTIET